VAEAAVKHGKFAGTPGSPAAVPELMKMGFRFIPVGADVLGLNPYYRDLAEEFNQHRPK
jgi:4-hydroxy-2-oxoheptanedioate aldolase